MWHLTHQGLMPLITVFHVKIFFKIIVIYSLLLKTVQSESSRHTVTHGAVLQPIILEIIKWY